MVEGGGVGGRFGVEEGLEGEGQRGGMVGAEEWLGWEKVEEGLEWRKVKEEEGLKWGNGRSGGMVKEEEWWKWGNDWSCGIGKQTPHKLTSVISSRNFKGPPVCVHHFYLNW